MHLLFQSSPATGYNSAGKCVRMKKKLKPEDEQNAMAKDQAMSNVVNNPLADSEDAASPR